MRFVVLAAGLFSASCWQQAVAAPHTFVSALNGNDANSASSCSRPAPCRSLDVAENAADDYGIVTMLDAGDYTPMDISKNITIEGQGPQTRIFATGIEGAAGIYCNNQYDVVLRNFSVAAAPGAGSTNGLGWLGGRSLTVENVAVNYPTAATAIGLYAQQSFDAHLKNVRATSYGGTGIGISTIISGAAYRIVIDGSTVENSAKGILVGGNGTVHLSISNSTISHSTGNGVEIGTTGATKLTIKDSQIVNNGGNGVMIAPTGSAKVNTVVISSALDGNVIGIRSFPASPATSTVSISDSSASNNVGGVHASGKSSVDIIRSNVSSNSSYGVTAVSPAAIRVGNSMINGNTLGLSGPISSYGNNQLLGNTTQGSKTPVAPGSVP